MSGLFTRNQLISQHYDYALAKIQEALRKMPDSDMLANSDEDLTEHFYEEWKRDPIEYDPDRDVAATRDTETRRVDRGALGSKLVEMQFAVIELPLVPKASNNLTLQLGCQTLIMSPVREMASFRVRDHMVVLRLPVDQSERLLEDLRKMIGHINREIERFTPTFRPRVLQQVKIRREQVETQVSKFEETMTRIGVEIKKKPGAVEPVNVKVRQEIKLLREGPSQPEQPVLTAEEITQIVGLIDQAGRGFEITPSAYTTLGEEQLRDIILGYLNIVFGLGAAIGEAFSKRGKTDIMLRVRDGSVLVAECKFWHGAKQFGETIDHLIRYLTWRHTYGIVITFSKNKGLTRVVEAAGEAVSKHESYTGELRTLGDTYFASIHTHPDDDVKSVEVHHLFYNLHAGGGAKAQTARVIT